MGKNNDIFIWGVHGNPGKEQSDLQFNMTFFSLQPRDSSTPGVGQDLHIISLYEKLKVCFMATEERFMVYSVDWKEYIVICGPFSLKEQNKHIPFVVPIRRLHTS